ncbi:hypothetical protein ACFSL6_15875 [Paenibacillus thailandensis]|uniref:Terpene synthase n=1 Tax=Paenibacillus thailandensis TaxID=393250 RepID=A0ABW5QXU1_9BACL
MKFVDQYCSEWNILYEQALELVSKYKHPLDARARLYLDQSLNPKEKDNKNYISYLLPYWMTDISEIHHDICRKISLACAFGMLSFFIQDDIMDNPNFQSKEDIVVAQLFTFEMNRLFHELFESDSPFWQHYRRYVEEWADGVSNESDEDYFIKSPLLVSKKASPVKLGSTAVLLLSDQAEMVPVVEKTVNWTLVSLQMSDDWVDWQEDFNNDGYNCLISHIIHTYKPYAPLDEKKIKNYLFVQSALDSYANIAELNLNNAVSLVPALSDLHAFHRSLVIGLRETANEIEQNKRSMLSGGFYYYVNNSTNQ